MVIVVVVVVGRLAWWWWWEWDWVGVIVRSSVCAHESAAAHLYSGLVASPYPPADTHTYTCAPSHVRLGSLVHVSLHLEESLGLLGYVGMISCPGEKGEVRFVWKIPGIGKVFLWRSIVCTVCSLSGRFGVHPPYRLGGCLPRFVDARRNVCCVAYTKRKDIRLLHHNSFKAPIDTRRLLCFCN